MFHQQISIFSEGKCLLKKKQGGGREKKSCRQGAVLCSRMCSVLVLASLAHWQLSQEFQWELLTELFVDFWSLVRASSTLPVCHAASVGQKGWDGAFCCWWSFWPPSYFIPLPCVQGATVNVCCNIKGCSCLLVPSSVLSLGGYLLHDTIIFTKLGSLNLGFFFAVYLRVLLGFLLLL